MGAVRLTGRAGFVDRVSAASQDVRVGRALLACIAAVFFAVGWLLGKVVVAVAWLFAAVRLGWIEAGAPTRDHRRRAGGSG